MYDRPRIWLRTVAWATVGFFAAASGASAADEPRDVPWLDDVQRSPASFDPQRHRFPPLLPPAADRAAWENQRAALKRRWLEYLGPFATESTAGLSNAVEVLQEEVLEKCVRRKVRYQLEKDLWGEGYLLTPKRPTPAKSLAGVVVLHATTPAVSKSAAGVDGHSTKAFGLGLAERGVVAFCPNNFLWVGEGDYSNRVAAFQKRHPGSRGMAKMLHDARRGLDVLAATPEVDADRLGAVGHSLGAKEVLYLAALDDRVRATVFSEGGVGVTFSNWNAPWYLGLDLDPRRTDHNDLLPLVAPRAFLLLAGEDGTGAADGDRSWPYLDAALPIYALYDGRPRIGLLNHREGHSVSEASERRIYEWLDAYLRAKPTPPLEK
ncbi:MAG: dienelactone hydrolase family protein [Planctomycetia bacterium]